jgi:hypothetical protein
VGILSTLDALLPRASTLNVQPGVPPGGRLTLASSAPVPTADVAAAQIFYVPYLHDTIQLWDAKASQWRVVRFVAPSVTLGAGNPASTGYDVFAYLNNGALGMEFGPAWTSATARSVDVQYTDGRVTKVGDKTRLLLGSVWTSAVAATTDSVASRLVSNAYNRVPRPMQVTEPATSWTYVGVFRQANANVLNLVSFMLTLPCEPIEAELQVMVSDDGTTPTRTISPGIGLDTSTANSATMKGSHPISGTSITQMHAFWSGFPAVTVGRHALTWVERASGTGTVTWYGTNASAANFQSGLTARVWA